MMYQLAKLKSTKEMKRSILSQIIFYTTCIGLTVSLLHHQNMTPFTNAISIKPSEFDGLIMPCYLGTSSSQSSFSGQPSGQTSPQNTMSSYTMLGSSGPGSYSNQMGRAIPNVNSLQAQSSPRYGQNEGLSNLGQQIPRANTIENFIALVSKIEAASPRLADNPDRLIKTLLSRFRMDNYYYDVRSRTPMSEPDHRADIIPALLSPAQLLSSQYDDFFYEPWLNQDEKCSMYFMLSHFIDKSSPSSSALAGTPTIQLAGPQAGQRPPVLQAAGTGYPAQAANNVFGSASNSRYPGPFQSFGSPATKNMNSFGAGLSNTPEYTGNNPYGMNELRPNTQFNQNYNNIRNAGQFSGTISSNSRYSPPYVDGNARQRDEKQYIEYGVVTVADQENSAIVLNRVLMGILSATTPSQTIRQLAASVYPTQSISNTPKLDDEIDPLFALTLADLWAVSSIPEAGKPLGFLGVSGHWNDTSCPTSFKLDKTQSIIFTTAELLGGLDGFNLGMFRRKMTGRSNIRLSDMLRMYYSRSGFKPQFSEVSVCNRAAGINSQMDDLQRQAENYLRLYQLNLPNSDSEIAASIKRLDTFKEVVRQTATQYSPPLICQDFGAFNDYSDQGQDRCEIASVDLVTLLDSSPQANDAFMNMVVTRLAQKLGLSAQGNSLTIMTNQQDSTNFGEGYSFNPIVRNSTNSAEIGCALTFDASRSYQGGQITEPVRLVEMFERTLVGLDNEYLYRKSYESGLYYQRDYSSRNTDGAKVIVWFNYRPLPKPNSISSSQTDWGQHSQEQSKYRFDEAKRQLRENFRGASILAVAQNREDVKDFVYEERDIFTMDTPMSSSSMDYHSSDRYMDTALSGPADQLVGKLLQRMCEVPATFQYSMCFKTPSDNVFSAGYISPGRKQYWMMSPKTFFASKSVRMVFKVYGGKLKVCFGRKPKPDENALKNGLAGISIGLQQQQATTNNYYTGQEALCKDVAQGEEIEFIVDSPCYRRSIADCEPFYYAIKETSNPGEGDMNYMCKDEGCKRFDQAKFTMMHKGVSCSSAFKMVQINWLLIMLSIVVTTCLIPETQSLRKDTIKRYWKLPALFVFILVSFQSLVQQVQAQQAGVYDFGQNRYGEKRGNFTPSEILAIIILVMTILVGLAFTIGLCYYVTKRNSRGMTRVEQNDY